MKIRIYTTDNFMDIQVKETYTQEQLLGALEEGSAVALDKEDNNIFILNMLNVVAIEIMGIPPISK